MTDFLPRILLYAAIAAALAGAGAVGASKYYGPRLKALQAEYDQFRGGVEALGRAAEKRKAEIELSNKLSKEKADRENKDATSKLLADVKRLRDERDRARGSIVPSAPADSRSPDLACFARTELESAIGELVGQLRGISQEGDQTALSLKVAREWAAGR